jgi:hypothetical protein
MKRNWKAILGMLTGIAIAGGTFIAHQLKAENPAAWGMKNSLLFSLGILIFIFSLLYREDNLLGSLVNTKVGRVYLSSALIGGCIVLIYIWVISIGTWTKWPATTYYYDLLANAFRQGHLHLEIKPDPALLALKDPYNPDNREGIPVLWDLALYKGEYYLYWGPVPALLLAAIKPFYATPVPDNVLTLIFIVGLLFFQILLILEIWKSYFQEAPGWTVLLCISFTGLINPILYMLVEPRIYEAAVAAAQFFFIGGLYWLFAAFKKPSLTNLALAGIFFTLTVGSRTTLLIPIAFLVCVALVWVIKSYPAKAIIFMTALTLPLALGGASYAWYNYQRFDSITEFGLGYQLTQTDIHETLDETFSLAYIPPNLFKLFVNPFEYNKNFPFIKATPWGGPKWLFKNYNPEIYDYFAEDITGILVGSPFLILACLATTCKQKNIHWITASLSGASLLIFFTLVLFFYLTMRDLLDLLPALSLLACIGFWQGFHLLRSRRIAKYLYAITGSGLWAYSIAVSFIISYSNNLHRIRIYNLELIQNITWTFTHLFK